MSATQLLVERNSARPLSNQPLPVEPSLRALVLTCADHRVDPAHILGLGLGEAVVIRNAGGRVTPGVMNDFAVLVTVAAIEELGSGFELVIMHHTDCGTSRLAGPEYVPLLAEYFGIDAEAVAGKCVTDPHASVRADLDLLRANPFIPRTLVVSGVVYDVVTGIAEVVCPPEPLGTPA